MFFEYSQNNTGGSFDVDDKLCPRVFIEASSCKEADAKLIALGGYFDGVEKEIDCPCCGDRWYSGHKLALPVQWNAYIKLDAIEDYVQYKVDCFPKWTTPEARIFYADGRVLEFHCDRDKEAK